MLDTNLYEAGVEICLGYQRTFSACPKSVKAGWKKARSFGSVKGCTKSSDAQNQSAAARHKYLAAMVRYGFTRPDLDSLMSPPE
jgi:hypothetical protein